LKGVFAASAESGARAKPATQSDAIRIRRDMGARVFFG
jgi:hypothetical protein